MIYLVTRTASSSRSSEVLQQQRHHQGNTNKQTVHQNHQQQPISPLSKHMCSITPPQHVMEDVDEKRERERFLHKPHGCSFLHIILFFTTSRNLITS